MEIKSEYLKRLLNDIKEKVYLMETYFYSREEARSDEYRQRMKVYSNKDNICNISKREM